MVLPETYISALLLLLVSMICWGSWANLLKLAGKWRFELFYFDYSLGVLLASIVAALTFGSLGDEMTFFDRMSVAGYSKWAWVFLGGVVFNLANMLLVAAISLAGMAVAFPVGIGLALIIGVLANYVIAPQANLMLIIAGVALVLIAIIADALAHNGRDRAKQFARTENPKTLHAPVGKSKKRRAAKGLVLSLISGVLMGAFYPLVLKGMGEGLLGLGPYAAALLFGIAVFLSTPIFNIYFMNLPVEGERVPISGYYEGTGRQHLLGIAGGAIWTIGMITNYVAASAPEEVNVGPSVSLAIGQCATMVSVLWGLFVWKEFAGAPTNVKRWLWIMMLFFIGGLVVLALAPVIK